MPEARGRSLARKRGSLTVGHEDLRVAAQHLVERRGAALGVPDDEEVGHAEARVRSAGPRRAVAARETPAPEPCSGETVIAPEPNRSRSRYSLSASTSRLKRRRSSGIRASSGGVGLAVDERAAGLSRSAPRRSRCGVSALTRRLERPAQPGRARSRRSVHDVVELLRAHRDRGVGLDELDRRCRRRRRGSAAPRARCPRCRRGSPRRSAPAPARAGNTVVVAAQLLDVADVLGVQQQLGPVRAARDAACPARRSSSSASARRRSFSFSTWVCSTAGAASAGSWRARAGSR